MEVVELNHPLVSHKLTILRDKQTGTKEFREIIGELATFLCYEAMSDAKLEEVEIETTEEEAPRVVVFEEALEAILFAAGHPITYATLARVFELTPAVVKDKVVSSPMYRLAVYAFCETTGCAYTYNI